MKRQMKLDIFYKSSPIDTFYQSLPLTPHEDESSYILTVDRYKMEVLKGYSLWSAAAYITSFMAGMGVLAMPHALAGTGWYGVILICLGFTNSWYSSTILGRSWLILEERWDEYRGKFRYPYPAIGMRAVGPWMRYVITIALHMSLIGTAVVYILLSAEVVGSIAQNIFILKYNYWIILLSVILCPLSWFGSIREFWFAAIGALATASLACIFLVVALTLNVPKESPTFENVSFSSSSLSFGTILFAFGGSFMCPTIQNDMADKKQFHKAALIGFIGISLLYLPITIVGYAILGCTVPSNILLSIQDGHLKTFIETCLAIHVILAFLLAINPVAQEYEEIFNVQSDFNYKRCIIRSLLVGTILLIAYAVPHFDKILNLVGGSTVTLLAFVFPPLFYLLLTKDADKKVSTVEKIYLLQVIVTGIAGGISCTYFAVIDIVKVYAGD